MSKVVVISGASAGVGRATVRKFAERQARIALLGRGRPGLEAARKGSPGGGRQGAGFDCRCRERGTSRGGRRANRRRTRSDRYPDQQRYGLGALAYGLAI